MIVCLRLEADGELIVELHKARVVHESAEHEARLAFHDPVSHGTDVGLVKAVDGLGLAIKRVLDHGPENAVLAVLAPSLRDDFQFDIGRLSVLVLEDALHDEHVLFGEGELHALAQS